MIRSFFIFCVTLFFFFFALFAFHCKDPSVHVNAGEYFLNKGKFDMALEEFEKASLIDPKDPRVEAGLGLILSLKRISLPVSLKLLARSS